jgi:hypothetical protein
MPVTVASPVESPIFVEKALGTVSVVMMASAARKPVALCLQRLRQPRADALHGERLHDDAGREREHLAGLAAEEPRELAADPQRPLHPVGAGAGVGVAGVHDQRPHLVPEILPADQHRSGAEPVTREDPGDAAARREAHDQQIAAIGLLDAGHGGTEFDAGDRMQGARIRRRQVYRHDLISRRISLT